MFATLLLPQFFLQAVLRHAPARETEPVALLDDEERKAFLLETNEAARCYGLEKGTSATQALARCPGLLLRTRDRTAETILQEILVQHAFMLSPFVESTAPGVCTLELARAKEAEKCPASWPGSKNLGCAPGPAWPGHPI